MQHYLSVALLCVGCFFYILLILFADCFVVCRSTHKHCIIDTFETHFLCFFSQRRIFTSGISYSAFLFSPSKVRPQFLYNVFRHFLRAGG